MTPAEFKCTRELLGFSAQWLAVRFNVSLRTIQRFEDGTQPIPAGISEELEEIDRSIAAAIDGYITFFGNKSDATLEVPRVDADAIGGLPASAHRAIAARVRQILPGLHLEFI
ncbi:MAG: hypothetical protein KGL39_23100 [Patescibacteria group bacterium]|nr:hypothetical protein [Patescibacteria group bacterium]